MCDTHHSAFSGATCSNNTAELTRLAKALRRICSFSSHGERVRFSFYSKHAASVTLGVAHARRNIARARMCHMLLMRSRHRFHTSFHDVFIHVGNAGNECADSATSLGMRGLVSVSNVPSFWPKGVFRVQHLFLRSLTASRRSQKFSIFKYACSWGNV